MDGQGSTFTKFLHSFHRITAPTHILGTPPLSLRHNEPNPVRSTTGGHTPIWTDRTHPLNGLKLTQLSNFLTHLLSDNNVLLEMTKFFDHPNLFPFPHHSYGNHTPSKGQEATPIPLYSIQYLHMIAFLHVWRKNYVKVLSHGPNSKILDVLYYIEKQ